MNFDYHSESYDISEPSFGYLYQDSITDIHISADTIIYNIHEWKKQNGQVYETNYTDYHLKSGEGQFLNNELNCLGFTDGGGYYSIFLTKPLSFEIINTDTIVSMYITSVSCEYFDNYISPNIDGSEYFTYKNGLGKTYMRAEGSGGVSTVELVGGVISGTEWGTQIIMGINEITNQQIRAYPNPCLDNININGLDNDFTFRIYNSTGIIIESGKSSKIITTDKLKAGIYFLEIQTKNNCYTTRIVKQ
jgi:hypothetical protein